MPDLSSLVPRLIAAGLILLIAFPVHEFAHALAAYRLGDSTARLFGRLSLNPIVHFDPLGGILLLVSVIAGMGIGWAKPTPVNPSNLRGGRNGEAIVALAGPVSNLVLASLGAFLFRLLAASGAQVPDVVLLVLEYFVFINVLLMVFNLIPLPPLDGSKVLYTLMDARTAWRVRPILEQYGTLILLIAVFFPIVGGQSLIGLVFNVIARPIVNLLLGA